jgi:protein SCO1/2
MDDATQKISRTIWVGVGLIIVILCISFVLSQYDGKKRPALPVLSQVANFSLTNQAGAPVTLVSLRGHVWVADIIFSRCPGPCATMTSNMKALQEALPASSKAKLISFTTDADNDTPQVLKEYGERAGANFERWSFLTGDKKDIAALARNSLLLTAIEKDAADRTDPNDLFVHSTIFVVVDQQGRLRGTFETTGDGVDFNKVRQEIVAVVAQLEREK